MSIYEIVAVEIEELWYYFSLDLIYRIQAWIPSHPTCKPFWTFLLIFSMTLPRSWIVCTATRLPRKRPAQCPWRASSRCRPPASPSCTATVRQLLPLRPMSRWTTLSTSAPCTSLLRTLPASSPRPHWW